MKWLKKMYFGLGLCLFLAIISYYLGNLFPIIGGPVFGIFLGILVRNLWGEIPLANSGVDFSSKKMLQFAIILLGSGLNLTQVYQAGTSSLVIIITTISAALGVAYLLGKFLKIDFSLTSLIGVGTSICGGSAIAAVAPIIEAEEKDIAYAISTVFLFNIVAVFTFPALGNLLGMSQAGFGLLAGTAINDTSSVVAAGYIYGNQAGDYATIVKLTRTLMIIPISLLFVWIIGVRHKKAHQESAGIHKRPFHFMKIFPWFILGFLLFSFINTVGLLDSKLMFYLKESGKFFIILALCAIGLKTDLKALCHTGFKPGILGMAIWFSIILVTLSIQWLSNQW